MSDRDSVVHVYDQQAKFLAPVYAAVPPEQTWGWVRELLPDGPGRTALDVGAGIGRDAVWLKSLGFDVVAAEPSAGMRREGDARYAGVRWIDDRLPDLLATHRLGLSFDLILLNAVWMHVSQPERARAFRKMVTLLKPGGVLVMTLRHGPAPPDRPMHAVSSGEVERLARDHGLALVRSQEGDDRLDRPGVSWTGMCLRLPDDGSGSLSLLRGIILNDDKSSTYKLGLLRAVARIADGAAALARPSMTDEDRVSVPMGLVALNWIRSYLPLVSAGVPQLPGNRGPDRLGFAKTGFRALAALGVAPQELRIGASFTGERANALRAALGEARQTIANMPVRYTTFPNSAAQVFTVYGTADRGRGAQTITADFLWAWGELSVPGPVWRTVQRLGAWVEPVLISEWARLSRGYAERMGMEPAPGLAEQKLVWLEPARDTGLARQVAERLQREGLRLECVWSGAPLRMDTLDIDHALPWSAWPCGDLWNLAPASRKVNQNQKRERLPSAAALAQARDRIGRWWEAGWLADPALAKRFEIEARASLPIGPELSVETVLDGLEWRRLRVQQDQHAPEWAGLGA